MKPGLRLRDRKGKQVPGTGLGGGGSRPPYPSEKDKAQHFSPLWGPFHPFGPPSLLNERAREEERLAGFCFQVNRERSLGWAVSRLLQRPTALKLIRALQVHLSSGIVYWTESNLPALKEGPGGWQGASHSPPPTRASVSGDRLLGPWRACSLRQGLHTSRAQLPALCSGRGMSSHVSSFTTVPRTMTFQKHSPIILGLPMA